MRSGSECMLQHTALQLSCKQRLFKPSLQNSPKGQKGFSFNIWEIKKVKRHSWHTVLVGVSFATPVSVWPWFSLFHIWCPGKYATCHLGYTTRAVHPSTQHQSLLAHAQSHRGPTLTTVLDYDDTFVSEERAALGHRHHFEAISRLRLLLCAGGWPNVTIFIFSSALVFRKELQSALYVNWDLRFNDHQGTFQRISALLVI